MRKVVFVALLCLSLGHAQNTSAMDPKYKEQYEREVMEAQKGYFLNTTGRANFKTMAATVGKARKTVLVVTSTIDKTLAQLLVNTSSRKVKVTVYTERAAYQKNPYYAQMARYGVQVKVLGRVNFSDRSNAIVVDDQVLFMGVRDAFVTVQGAYPRYMRESLESAERQLQ